MRATTRSTSSPRTSTISHHNWGHEMSIDRRHFLLSAAAVAAAPRVGFAHPAAVEGGAAEGSVFPASVRADFPIASAQTYLNCAAIHPMSTVCAKALQDHVAFRTQGGGAGRSDFDEAQLADLKQRYATLIGARPTEIAFVQNTSDGENIVVMGMDLAKRGGN